MSNFESFYGGRQGISFTIVKRFDGINLPSVPYKKRIFATDGLDHENEETLPFIEEVSYFIII